MRKLFVLALFVCFLCSPAHAFNPLIVCSGGVSSPVSCSLMDETFDGSDGTNITADGWTATGDDPGDWIELDTAAKRTGTAAVLIDVATATADRSAYKTFTEQTSGTFTIVLYARTDGTEVATRVFFEVEDDSGNDVMRLMFYSGDLDYRYSGTWAKVLDITANNWFGVKITLNVTAHTFDVDADSNNDGTFDTSVTTGAAFENNVNPSRILLSTYNNTATKNVWVDDLCIE